MVQRLRNQAPGLARVAGSLLGFVLGCFCQAAMLWAEAPPVHYLNSGVMPPGAIGSQQLLRGGPLPGYFQPVEIKVPPGAQISTALGGDFDRPQDGPALLGLLIGAVYRLRVTGIPFQPGLELFPTLEVIDRLYPPLGQEAKFPIPVEVTQEELEMALSGRFVTRVIYVEDPELALPVASDPAHQEYFEAAKGDNPLDVADRLGRPVAILRMGGRVPDADGPDQHFLYGSPALLKYTLKRPVASQPRGPSSCVSPTSALSPRPALSKTQTTKHVSLRQPDSRPQDEQ
jgi:hypothetical protein